MRCFWLSLRCRVRITKNLPRVDYGRCFWHKPHRVKSLLRLPRVEHFHSLRSTFKSSMCQLNTGAEIRALPAKTKHRHHRSRMISHCSELLLHMGSDLVPFRRSLTRKFTSADPYRQVHFTCSMTILCIVFRNYFIVCISQLLDTVDFQQSRRWTDAWSV